MNALNQLLLVSTILFSTASLCNATETAVEETDKVIKRRTFTLLRLKQKEQALKFIEEYKDKLSQNFPA